MEIIEELPFESEVLKKKRAGSKRKTKVVKPVATKKPEINKSNPQQFLEYLNE